MKVVYKDSFIDRLDSQVEYISKDSPTRARQFKNDLLTKTEEIAKWPLRYRKSIYFDSEDIRDLIFKGYTIVFRIAHNRIEVFGFVKYKNSVAD